MLLDCTTPHPTHSRGDASSEGAHTQCLGVCVPSRPCSPSGRSSGRSWVLVRSATARPPRGHRSRQSASSVIRIRSADAAASVVGVLRNARGAPLPPRAVLRPPATAVESVLRALRSVLRLRRHGDGNLPHSAPPLRRLTHTAPALVHVLRKGASECTSPSLPTHETCAVRGRARR